MLDYKDYVYAAYIHRNFSKAAREVHVSQPWFSSAIKKTEQEIGMQLFDRSTSPMSMTEAGKYFIQQIERIYSIENDMKLHFAQMRANTGEKLRIGSSMFFCTYVLPDILQDFCDQHPQTKLSFKEGNTRRLTDRLLNGEIDMIFEVEEIDHRKITTVPWSMEELVLAVPAWYDINEDLTEYQYSFEEYLNRDEPDLMKPCVPLEKFADQPFLILSEENDLHNRAIHMCQNAGFDPDIKLMMDQLMTAYYLTCEGQGITFIRSAIPEHVVATDNIVFYRIGDKLARRNVYYSYIESEMSATQAELLDYLKNESYQLYGM